MEFCNKGMVQADSPPQYFILEFFSSETKVLFKNMLIVGFEKV